MFQQGKKLHFLLDLIYAKAIGRTQVMAIYFVDQKFVYQVSAKNITTDTGKFRYIS